MEWKKAKVISSIEKYSFLAFEKYELCKLKNPWSRRYLTKRQIANLAISISCHESNLDPNSRMYETKLKCYSYGLMSILTMTARTHGWDGKDIEELFKPGLNAKCGTNFLCEQIQKYDGNIIEALAAYNAGKCRVDNFGVIMNQRYIDCVWPIYVSLNKKTKKLYTD
jgi:soluble lytic murein transglycosylase-like protein